MIHLTRIILQLKIIPYCCLCKMIVHLIEINFRATQFKLQPILHQSKIPASGLATKRDEFQSKTRCLFAFVRRCAYILQCFSRATWCVCTRTQITVDQGAYLMVYA